MSALGDSIRNARFAPVRLREGYDMSEVDALLDQMAAAADAGRDLAPFTMYARFSSVRMREGYSMAEVDRFLESLGGAPSTSAASTAVEAQPVIQERRGWLSRLFGGR